MAREISIAVCQYLVREISSFDELAQRVRNLLDQTQNAQLVLFPELFTIELFTTLDNWRHRPISELTLISRFTEQYRALFTEEAKRRNQYIAAGTHLEEVAPGRFENIAHLFTPDGQDYRHSKTHIFPAENDWNTSEGNQMNVIELPFAKVGFNICYETEIPECSASLTEQGVEIILSPSATFTENGFWRVRHCAQARCIENQVYVVHCGLGGQPGAPLPNGWTQSSVLSPCDLAWPNPAGIVAQAEANKETVAVATVDLDLLYENRRTGAATTFKDRRRKTDLYRSWPSHI